MRWPAAIPLALAAILAAGCGSVSEATPVACLEGPGAFLHALRGVPGEATLGGRTPISGCLPRNQQAGQLADVGAAMLIATTRLNAEARGEPGGAANLRLGYLLGAVQRGAARTGGIHAELVRRLAAAARYSPEGRPLPLGFLRAYRHGYDAGHARG
jgi:hypothetical protein